MDDISIILPCLIVFFQGKMLYRKLKFILMHVDCGVKLWPWRRISTENYSWNNSFDCTISDLCQLKQDMGTCYDYTIKWFYDASISRCRRFYYGSCGGNGNRFETREDCVMTCVERKVKPIVEVAEKGSRLHCMWLAWLLIHELTTRWHGCMFTNSEHDCLSEWSCVEFVQN